MKELVLMEHLSLEDIPSKNDLFFVWTGTTTGISISNLDFLSEKRKEIVVMTLLLLLLFMIYHGKKLMFLFFHGKSAWLRISAWCNSYEP